LLSTVGLRGEASESASPSLGDVVTSSINIMQMRIARSRLAGEPADVLVSPRVAELNMMEFDRARDAIDEGVAAVKRVLPSLQHTLGTE
jgi:NTE family protein